MRKTIIGLILLICSPLIAVGFQDIGGDGSFRANKAQLFKTYTTYTATSDDTSAYITIVPPIGSDILLCREVRLIAVSTDSLAADINVIGINGHLTAIAPAAYTDSIVISDSVAAGPNSGTKRIITIKGTALDRLIGATQMRVGTVFRASGQGTTAGRTLKWYVLWVK
jgi:hypothetical protein